ncbi:MAG: PhoH family protein [Saprospiraceae bacterium]|nr:PhoH family protein [Saprospiraceae bacterium]
MTQSEIILNIENIDPIDLLGENNSKLNILRKAYPDILISSRGNQLKISGRKKRVPRSKDKVETMVRLLKDQKELSNQTIEDLIQGNNPYQQQMPHLENRHVLVHGREGKTIYAKTKNQLLLVQAVEENDVVFAIGPAGTGKTYTAVALAVRALKNKFVKKIILTRPAVEAGENLGFLPGDLKEKIDPYLRPLYDALDDMIPAEKLELYIQNRVIEIAPLAFMRGRTLDNAFIILDEAQNSSALQMKMFLTRLGPTAKCIITGDLSQIDLPYRQTSGLKQAANILGKIKGITTIHLTIDDVVRHRLVKEILKAYDELNQSREAERNTKMEEE